MKIGIMQGRLSPKEPQLLQSFPWEYWEDEFERAKIIGYSFIEWLVDKPNWKNNPLLTVEGRNGIRALMDNTGVNVQTLCAHYFIDGEIISENETLCTESIKVLNILIKAAADLGVSNIVLPFFDNATLIKEKNVDHLKKSLKDSIGVAAEYDVNILIESDLNANKLQELIISFNSESVGVCYDIGNAASLGFDVISEINKLAPYIYEIHIKDRKINGGSVMLGKGDAPIKEVIKHLVEKGYRKPIILETPVGDDWEKAARDHYDYMSL